MSSLEFTARLAALALGVGVGVSVVAGCADEGGAGEGSDPHADAVVHFAPADGASFGHEDMPSVVLGPPGGTFDVVSLGCEGSIELELDEPGIVDGPGVDLIVFENPFSADFPEPGEVSVSADGISWAVFPCAPTTLEGCAGVTPTLALPGSGIDPRAPGLAGGDGFDLAALQPPLAAARFVRIEDRSRAYWAAHGELSFCDPGQQGAGGFDLDAIAAVHEP